MCVPTSPLLCNSWELSYSGRNSELISLDKFSTHWNFIRRVKGRPTEFCVPSAPGSHLGEILPQPLVWNALEAAWKVTEQDPGRFYSDLWLCILPLILNLPLFHQVILGENTDHLGLRSCPAYSHKGRAPIADCRPVVGIRCDRPQLQEAQLSDSSACL